ncbi:MAG: carboxypeptidase-like regulatory domain-containing protein [Bacteroidota bacterium]
MDTEVNLSQVRPCSQDWDNMPEHEEGRLCLLCQETIHDFRGMSDWEIAVKHAHSPKKLCGLYDRRKKPKSLHQKGSQKSSKALFMASIMGFLVTQSPALSQTSQLDTTVQFPVAEEPSSKKNNLPIIQSNKHENRRFLVSGIVRDSARIPIEGVTILIEGTQKGVLTDKLGAFTIDVSEQIQPSDSIGLIISYIGYGQDYRIIKKESFPSEEDLVLDIVIQEQSDISVFEVQHYKKVNWFWYKIKQFFKRLKNLLA